MRSEEIERKAAAIPAEERSVAIGLQSTDFADFVLKREGSLDTIHGIHPHKEKYEHEL